jgi:hypothetical protein
MVPMLIYAGVGKLKKVLIKGEEVNWIPVDVWSHSLVDLTLNVSSDLSSNDPSSSRQH